MPGEQQEAAAELSSAELRRGPWTVDEDLTLINYISDHGEGRWNALARAAGKLRYIPSILPVNCTVKVLFVENTSYLAA